MQLGKKPDVSAVMVWPQPEVGQEQALNIDNFFDAFISVNHEGLITGWNLQAEDTFGWPRRDALGRSVAEVIVPARNRHVFEQTMQQFSTEKSARKSRIIITALHLDGQEFEAEMIVFAIPRNDGAGIFARQLGQRNFTEAEAAKRHHAFMDQLGECYSETDLRGNYIFINKAYREIFGASTEAREGLNYKQTCPN